MHEQADAAWVVSTHDVRRMRAPTSAAVAALSHPDDAVRGPPGRTWNGLVGSQALIDDVFAAVDSYTGGLALLHDDGLDVRPPAPRPPTYEGRRRNVTLTLCGDRRGRTPMHVVAIGGRDPDVAARSKAPGCPCARPAGAGGSRPASATSRGRRASWTGSRPRRPCTSATWPGSARPGDRRAEQPALHDPASSVRPGMAMFTADGDYDVVVSVRAVPFDRPGVRHQRRGHAQLRRRRTGDP